ncbi:hypothetical protein EDC94DRAFT_589369 [Helicostylum pulchrum]|nr:hypothetical protein EDC94DRAFT_589369 [Helicostylum pulchrum]
MLVIKILLATFMTCLAILNFKPSTVTIKRPSNLTPLSQTSIDNTLSNNPSSSDLTELLLLQDNSSNSIELPPTRKRFRLNQRQSYIPTAVSMGPTTTKRNDSKLMSTPSSKNKSHSAIYKDKIILNKGRNLVNTTLQSDMDYLHVLYLFSLTIIGRFKRSILTIEIQWSVYIGL